MARLGSPVHMQADPSSHLSAREPHLAAAGCWARRLLAWHACTHVRGFKVYPTRRWVCLYDVEERLLLRRVQISANRSLDGVLDQLSSRHVTDAGPAALIDDAPSDEENGLLPPTATGKGQAGFAPALLRACSAVRHRAGRPQDARLPVLLHGGLCSSTLL